MTIYFNYNEQGEYSFWVHDLYTHLTESYSTDDCSDVLVDGGKGLKYIWTSTNDPHWVKIQYGSDGFYDVDDAFVTDGILI